PGQGRQRPCGKARRGEGLIFMVNAGKVEQSGRIRAWSSAPDLNFGLFLLEMARLMDLGFVP
ncbi:MAG TPA: hypothetical protein VMW51_06930, partial [Terriglobia bacterium]|nr:hypothetical protein [Terriglobia bacterium]